MWDDEAGYDTTDPKHPGFLEMWLAHADLNRKREREDPVQACSYEDVDESGGVRDA